jgi:UDP-N-acetylmuramate--alanine ligase
VPAEVVRRAGEGDVVVTMGAPPISLMGDELLDALARRGAGGRAADGSNAAGGAGPASPGVASVDGG